MRAFGLLELGIASWSTALPFLLAAAQALYVAVARAYPDTYCAALLRPMLAALMLFPPTIMMGATLPILASSLRADQRFARHFGFLYGANTIGAVAGILLCGFQGLPNLGLRITNFVAVGLSAGVGIVALVADRRIRSEPMRSTGFFQPTVETGRGVLYVTAVLWGFLALALELVWFRALILVMGSTTYSFTPLMTATFLAGISLGAIFWGRAADAARHPATLALLSLLGLATWTWGSVCLLASAPEWYLQVLLRTDFSWMGSLLAKLLIATFFLVPLAVCFGIAFTAIVKALQLAGAAPERAAAGAGLYNGIGAAGGALAGGLCLLPALGTRGALPYSRSSPPRC
ncbi:MAG: hypothetical protein O3B24_05925 [Verrucomicrobia bacterium]|nr:hypothetical protein [Verrucomicrobiota bacterium]